MGILEIFTLAILIIGVVLTHYALVMAKIINDDINNQKNLWK